MIKTKKFIPFIHSGSLSEKISKNNYFIERFKLTVIVIVDILKWKN